jgi:hypothetical protein
VKVLLAGAGVSLAAGLLLGGAMQPHLDEGDDRPAGPQMIADWAGDRSTGPFDPGTSFASYRGQTPDYVMGTDWKKAMAGPDERAAVSASREAVFDEAPPTPDEPAVLTRAAYDEPAPAPHAYPSLEGGRAAAVPEPDEAPDAGG